MKIVLSIIVALFCLGGCTTKHRQDTRITLKNEVGEGLGRCDILREVEREAHIRRLEADLHHAEQKILDARAENETRYQRLNHDVQEIAQANRAPKKTSEYVFSIWMPFQIVVSSKVNAEALQPRKPNEKVTTQPHEHTRKIPLPNSHEKDKGESFLYVKAAKDTPSQKIFNPLALFNCSLKTQTGEVSLKEGYIVSTKPIEEWDE